MISYKVILFVPMLDAPDHCSDRVTLPFQVTLPSEFGHVKYGSHWLLRTPTLHSVSIASDHVNKDCMKALLYPVAELYYG